ncbi:MAG: hypothetical protein CME60_04555 [Halobacteriovoraceae bacterium]|nr:hypothetical protein [Halobacteriovoraceae bacterium]
MLDRLIYFIVRALSCTYRYQIVSGAENLQKARELSPSRGYLFAIWHQNLFQGITAQTGDQHVVIVSRSKDANPVAYTCRKLGHVVCRGSSRAKDGRDKGGKVAMEEMVQVLQKGLPGAVTVDGPKGPAKEVKPGIIAMAKKSQTAIIPYAPLATSYWEFKSWDRFRLPKPFSKINISYGEPILVADEDFSHYQELLKEKLNQIS